MNENFIIESQIFKPLLVSGGAKIPIYSTLARQTLPNFGKS
jgi:hypothetical protein